MSFLYRIFKYIRTCQKRVKEDTKTNYTNNSKTSKEIHNDGQKINARYIE